MATKTVRVGDVVPIPLALEEDTGAAVDLSGLTVSARMVRVADGLVAFDARVCTVTDAAGGLVSVPLQSADTALAREGVYDLTVRSTDGSNPRTFPARGSVKVEIIPR